MSVSCFLKFCIFLLMPALLITQTCLAAEKTTADILSEYPSLNDYFPFGIWQIDDEGYSNIYPVEFTEPYYTRLEKIYDNFSRNHFTAIIPSNRKLTKQHLDLAQKYGMRITTLPYLLHSQMDSKGKPSGNSIDFQWVKGEWSKHISEIKDHPALLSYHIFDEIHPDAADSVREVLEYVETLDSLHPATYTHQCLPFTGWDNEKKLMDAVDVKISDCYSVCRGYGRDPWMYGDIALPEWRRTNPKALEWPIIQAFDWHQPAEIGELRVMVYRTLGTGAKGMFFFVSGQVCYTWGEKAAWPAIGDVWFNQNALLSELNKIGSKLSVVGPLLVSMDYQENYPINVNCNTLFAKVNGLLRPSAFINMPAIHTGVFTGNNYDVAVVSNDDPWRNQKGLVNVRVKNKGTKIYDLYDLKPVIGECNDLVFRFEVQFEPGDGRLYLIGDDAAFEDVQKRIQKHRYQNEFRFVERDLNHAKVCNVNINAAQKTLDSTATLVEKGDFANAIQTLSKVNLQIEAAIKAKPTVLQVRNDIEYIRTAFGAINTYFNEHPDTARGQLCSDKVKGFIQETKRLTKEFCRIENSFRAGEPLVDDASKLKKEVNVLKTQVVQYRPENLIQKRIALLQLDQKSKEVSGLGEWLRNLYTTVDIIEVSDSGNFQYGKQDVKLSDYDVLWFHIGGQDWPADSKYSVSAKIDKHALNQNVCPEIKNHVSNGGGLVLSGLALSFLPELGLDPSAPNECYWGPIYLPGNKFVSFIGQCKSLGVKPLDKGHAIFAGLPAEGFSAWDYDEMELVTKAVWHCPSSARGQWGQGVWPVRGKILAGYYSEGVETPDNFVTIMDYSESPKGNVIAIGDGIDMILGQQSQPATPAFRTGTNQEKLLKNIVSYCSEKTRK